jgi:methionine aminopeptidase
MDKEEEQYIILLSEVTAMENMVKRNKEEIKNLNKQLRHIRYMRGIVRKEMNKVKGQMMKLGIPIPKVKPNGDKIS